MPVDWVRQVSEHIQASGSSIEVFRALLLQPWGHFLILSLALWIPTSQFWYFSPLTLPRGLLGSTNLQFISVFMIFSISVVISWMLSPVFTLCLAKFSCNFLSCSSILEFLNCKKCASSPPWMQIKALYIPVKRNVVNQPLFLGRNPYPGVMDIILICRVRSFSQCILIYT